MRFWLTRYQFLLILVLALPVCPSEDFAMPLDAPASHAAESPAQPSRAEQLGAFLRRRRESIEPQRVGISRLGRRRTPGLRREEVAQLAGVGVTWYTWLEQGRAVRASEQVIGAIARAGLATPPHPPPRRTPAGGPAPPGAGRAVCEKPSAATQAILDALDPLPAMVQNARFDIRGYNRAYCRLVGIDLAEIPEEDRNCIYLALTHERWRYCMANREEALPRMVGFFRAAMVERMGDPLWERQLQRCLEASAEFREIWRRNEVMGIENQLKRFRHARCGEFELQQTNWWSAPKNGDRLLVFVPLDDHARDCLEQL
ncbi:helix-turn-helix domain-containing protein [Pseudomonas aeruginosa]|nr:helix-turn-helix domain-containing protein [Pseudomonas aeruginosa]